MAKAKTPSYVVELLIAPVRREEDRQLWASFEAAKRLTNVMLQHGTSLVKAMRCDPAWVTARLLPKATKPQQKARAVAFTSIRSKYGFSEYEFHKVVAQHKNKAGFTDRVGANVAQKIGTRVFKACEKWLTGAGGKPRFKGRKRPLHSIEEKNHSTGIRWDSERRVVLVQGMKLSVQMPDLKKDEWLASALNAKTKYCRLVWRNVGNCRRYFVQLVQEGAVPIKASVLERLAPEGTVGGLDIGPSNVGWVTETEGGLQPFCEEIKVPEQSLRRLQRKIDRQRRASNQDNYDPQGRAKKNSRTWIVSRRQQQTEARVRSTLTHLAYVRKNAHGKLTNDLMSKARSWRDDGVSAKTLQRNYGRSVGKRAPGMFLDMLSRKAERAGGSRVSQNARQLKTSQFDHPTQRFEKKPLKQRWHRLGDGSGVVQRDVYSAFLARNAVQTIDDDGVIGWKHDADALATAWAALNPALQHQGLLRKQAEASEKGSASIPCASDANRKSAKQRVSRSRMAASVELIARKPQAKSACRTTGLSSTEASASGCCALVGVKEPSSFPRQRQASA